MTPQEYLEFTRTTAARTTSGISDEDWARYVYLGLISEVGEVAGQVKRIIRDDGGVLTPERREKLLDELGDVLWYWAQMHDVEGVSLYGFVWQGTVSTEFNLARFALEVGWMTYTVAGDGWVKVALVGLPSMLGMLGSTLEEVAARNVAKLSGRVAAGTIHGEGDER